MEQKNMLAEQQTVTEAVAQKDITDSVLRKVNDLEQVGTLKMPTTYNPGNALKSAWLKLQSVQDRNKRPALEVCTRTSIANALFDMCIQGLSPAKNQCYFIVRGNELTMMRSYFGTVAVLKRLSGVEDVFADVVYQDDTFEYEIENGNIVNVKHHQEFKNIDTNKIVGAYCTIVKDGKPRTEVMTMAQIRQSWSHSSNGGSVQKEYPDQMAKRTVINRAAKMYVNTCDDADDLIQAINDTTEAEYDNEPTENGEAVTIPSAAEISATEAQTVIEIPTEKKAQPEAKKAERRKPEF